MPCEGHVDVSGKARSAPKTRFPHRTHEVFILSLRKKKKNNTPRGQACMCVFEGCCFFLRKFLSVCCSRVNARNIRLHCNCRERRIHERRIYYCCRGQNSTFPQFTYGGQPAWVTMGKRWAEGLNHEQYEVCKNSWWSGCISRISHVRMMRGETAEGLRWWLWSMKCHTCR